MLGRLFTYKKTASNKKSKTIQTVSEGFKKLNAVHLRNASQF
jgi:hypothetical protein